MPVLRTAVIGVGYLGRFHAQKYAQAADCRLVAVVDASEAARTRVGAETGVRPVADYHELLGEVDAVSVVTPHGRILPAASSPGCAGRMIMTNGCYRRAGNS
jgi:predicted dehydrogenase